MRKESQQSDRTSDGAASHQQHGDNSAGSSKDVVIAQNQWVVHTVEINALMVQEQISYGVVDGFEDALDEMFFQHVSGISGMDNRSGWKTWISGWVADNALITEGEIEKEALIGHDLNRIAPKGFLKIPMARKALIKELMGLTRPGRNGNAAMEIVSGNDKVYRTLRRNPPMVAMRKKTPNTFKARLASRGDLASEDDVAFASAPTANRVSTRTVICVARLFNFRIGNVDATQAFLQSDTVAFLDRKAISSPGFIKLPKSNRKWENGKYRNLIETDFKILGWGE